MNQWHVMTRDPEILGGVPVFAGTRVPVRTLLDYFQRNHDLDEFLADYPTVRRNQAIDFLKELEHFVDNLAQPA